MSKAVSIILGDRHISENFSTIKSVTEQTIALAISRGVSMVIDAGDVFTYKRSQTTENLKIYLWVLNEFEEAGIEVISIVGNHDKPRGDDEFSFLTPFSSHPALRLIGTHEAIQIGGMAVGFLSFFKATYVERLSILKKEVSALKAKLKRGGKSGISVLVTHIGVDGATDNDGRTIKSSMDESLFKGFSKVYSGHYHNRSEAGRVEYVGSMYQANYGEDTEKGAAVLMDDGTIEFEQFSFPTFGTKVIDVELAQHEDIVAMVKQASTSVDFLRVVLTGSKESLSSVDKGILMKAGAAKIMKDADGRASEAAKDEPRGELRKYGKSELIEKGKAFFIERGYSDAEVGVSILKEALNG